MGWKLWRAIALCAIVAAIAFVAVDPFLPIPRYTMPIGVATVPTASAMTYRVSSVSRRRPPAGIQIGMLIEALHDTASARTALTVQPNPGQRLRVRVVAPRAAAGRIITLHAANTPFFLGPLGIAFNVIRLLMLIVAGMLAWRRPEDGASRALVVLLASFGYAASINSDAIPSPLLAIIFQFMFRSVLLLFGSVAAVLFAANFPQRSGSLLIRRATWLLVAVTLIVILEQIVWQTIFLTGGRAPWPQLQHLLVGIFPLNLMAAVAILTARLRSVIGDERQRLLWVLAILAAGFSGVVFDVAWQLLLGYNASVDMLALTMALIPLGLAYVMLRHRILDVGFALNRAVVYAGVSILIVAVFVVLESVLAKYIETTSHLTSLAVQLAVPLGLGFSIRYIHAKVDAFVDRSLFRQRHECEAAIRRFAHEAAMVTRLDDLLEKTLAVVMAATHASSTTIYLHASNGSFIPEKSTLDGPSAIDENDWTALRLRTWLDSVDLDGAQTAMPGRLALPMVVRGELLGILTLGKKSTNEEFAPDEREALQTLAHSVGMAIDALAVATLRDISTRLLTGHIDLDQARRAFAGLATSGGLGPS